MKRNVHVATEGKRVGIWIRVSTEDQVRGESPETHERRARLYAEAKGWTVVDVYRLDAVSGKTVRETPEAQRMLVDIRSGKITGLIFSKLARLARNTKELLEFSDIFRECGADLISLAESIDTSTPAGRLFYTMIAAMAQWEREEISERIAASIPIRALQGKPLSGNAPYGYMWVDKKMCLHPEEAPVRKYMYELYRTHRNKKKVIRLLTEEGYRTRGGVPFSSITLTNLLQDPITKGTRRANFTTKRSAATGSRLKPESEWIVHDIEPIVSEELWNECNEAMKGDPRLGVPRSKPAVHLFSGIAFCTCGGKMYVPSNSPKYTCQKCRNKIPPDDLEAIFHEQVKGFLFSTDEIVAQLDKVHVSVKEKSELLLVLEKELGKVTDETDKLYDLYQANMIDKTGFGVKYKPLAERRDQLDDQLARLQAEVDVLKITELSQEVALESARDLHTRWPSLPFEEKRRVIETIVEKITIGDGEVEITLWYTPPPSTRGGSSGNQGGTPPYTPSQNHGKKDKRAHACLRTRGLPVPVFGQSASRHCTGRIVLWHDRRIHGASARSRAALPAP